MSGARHWVAQLNCDWQYQLSGIQFALRFSTKANVPSAPSAAGHCVNKQVCGMFDKGIRLDESCLAQQFLGYGDRLRCAAQGMVDHFA